MAMARVRKRRRRKRIPIRDPPPVASDDVDEPPLSLDPVVAMCLRGDDLIAIRYVVDTAGQDVNAKDPKTGQTPLMAACAKGDVPLVRFLLCRGALVHQRDKQGYTALHHAANAPTGLLLLRAGACSSFATNDGGAVDLTQLLTSPLPPRTIQDMVLSGDLDAVKARLDSCGDLPNARDNAGRTLLRMLLDDSNPKLGWMEAMVSLLTSYGAKSEGLVYHEV